MVNVGGNDPAGKDFFNFIKNHELGILGVVFDIDGVEESRSAAEALGIEIPFKFDFSEKELKILGMDGYTKYLEYFMEPSQVDNTMILLSDFQYE